MEKKITKNRTFDDYLTKSLMKSKIFLLQIYLIVIWLFYIKSIFSLKPNERILRGVRTFVDRNGLLWNKCSFVATFKILQNMKCLQNLSLHGIAGGKSDP